MVTTQSNLPGDANIDRVNDEESPNNVSNASKKKTREIPMVKASDDETTKLSKTLSWILRRNARSLGLNVLPDDWVLIADIADHTLLRELGADAQQIRDHAASCPKQRFEVADDKIRASSKRNLNDKKKRWQPREEPQVGGPSPAIDMLFATAEKNMKNHPQPPVNPLVSAMYASVAASQQMDPNNPLVAKLAAARVPPGGALPYATPQADTVPRNLPVAFGNDPQNTRCLSRSELARAVQTGALYQNMSESNKFHLLLYPKTIPENFVQVKRLEEVDIAET